MGTLPTRTTRRGFRPRLEALEDRCQPSAVRVTTTLDAVADDGQTSLREALAAAALDPGPSLIKLPPGAYPLSLGSLVIDDPSGRVTIRAYDGHLDRCLAEFANFATNVQPPNPLIRATRKSLCVSP